MGFLGGSGKAGGNGSSGGWLKGLVRRKQVDSAHAKSGGGGHHQLAKELSVLHLIAIGKCWIKLELFRSFLDLLV